MMTVTGRPYIIADNAHNRQAYSDMQRISGISISRAALAWGRKPAAALEAVAASLRCQCKVILSA